MILVKIVADLCFAMQKKTKTVEEENACWKETYGEEGAKIIRDCVDANIPDYEYLKSFALKVPFKAPGEA